MNDPVLSHKEIVQQICLITAAVLFAFDTETDPDAAKPWDAMDETEQETLRHQVHRVLRMSGMPVDLVHRDLVEELEADGWKRGFVYNESAKESPSIRPFAELPLRERQRFAIFVAGVRAIYD